MTLYGNESRVSVDVSGGAIAGVDSASARKLVVFALGDTANANAQPNDPVRVDGSSAAEAEFGADSELAEQMRLANVNGVNYGMMWGVMPEVASVSNETIDNDELDNAPIIEDRSTITVTNTSQSQEEDVEFRYGSPPDNSNLSGDTVAINPVTGEFNSGNADSYDVSYDYPKWQAAIDSARDVVEEQEFGHWVLNVEAESVISYAASLVGTLRQDEWKMITLNGGTSPNDTMADGTAMVDSQAYTDGLDDGALFVNAPARTGNGLVNGAVGGTMAANDIEEPIIGDRLEGVDSLLQTLTVVEQEALEDEKVIPLSNNSVVRIEGNVATSTKSDWLRTFFSRRVADELLLIARAIAKAARGRLNSDNTEDIVEQRMNDEIFDMIDRNILLPNKENERRWYVNVDQDETNRRELNVDFGFTPTGVVDIVTVNQTITY